MATKDKKVSTKTSNRFGIGSGALKGIKYRGAKMNVHVGAVKHQGKTKSTTTFSVVPVRHFTGESHSVTRSGDKLYAPFPAGSIAGAKKAKK